MPNLYDLVLSSRSRRAFDGSRPIERETLLHLVDMARLTASSINDQPLRYYVVSDPEQALAIRPHTGWAKKLPDYDGPGEGEHPTAYIIICVDTSRGSTLERFAKDIGIVAQTIYLGATEAGFGGCMLGSFAPEPIAQITGIDRDRYKIALLVALGYPTDTIVLEKLTPGEKTDYYRTDDGVHHVPKYALEDILL